MENKQSVCINDYDYTPYLLHSGRQSKIYKAINRLNSDPIKSTLVFKGYPESVLSDPSKEKKLNQQLNILWKLNGKENVLQIFSQHCRDKQVFIITEYCDNGTLLDEVRRNGKLVEEKAIAYVQQIIRGYQFVHAAKVVHRQLDPSNILNAGLELKIADFSEAILQHELNLTAKREEMVGLLPYQAPEVLANYRYSTKTDIYSIGVIFYFMLTGNLPYEGANRTEMLRNIKTDSIETKLPPNLHKKSMQFLIKTMAFEEEERMGIDELVSYEFEFMPHLKHLKFYTFDDDHSDLIIEQSLLGKKTSLEPQGELRQTDNNRYISGVDLKASEEDIGRHSHEKEVSIFIPSKLDINTLGNIISDGELQNLHIDKVVSMKSKNSKFSKQSTIKQVKETEEFLLKMGQRLTKKNFKTEKVVAHPPPADVTGPLTSRGRENIKAELEEGAGITQNTIIANWLLSHVDMFRLLNRVCFRLAKISKTQENALVLQLQGLGTHILAQIDSLTILEPTSSLIFKNTPEHIKLKQIIKVYRDRGVPTGKYSDLQTLSQHLQREISIIFSQIVQACEFKPEHVKTLDFLVTVWQLVKLLKKKDPKIFYEKSKIDQIVDGEEERATLGHLLQLHQRMKTLKLVNR